jgi:hypothetical protein
MYAANNNSNKIIGMNSFNNSIIIQQNNQKNTCNNRKNVGLIAADIVIQTYNQYLSHFLLSL